jgi:very-short-patch-repair endonuclease
MTGTMVKLIVEAARDQGWDVANVGEAEVAHQLTLLGYTPSDVETQFRLGPYRLDFAIPAERIDIEADGWVHGTRQVRARDSQRDRTVREWGWVVVRIDTERGDTAAQLRRHVPDRSRIKDYGGTLRQVDYIFKAHLDRLQRHGIAEPAAQLGRMRDKLLASLKDAP